MLGAPAMRFAVAGLSLVLLLGSPAARAASSSSSSPAHETPAEANATPSWLSGARFQLGALVLAHVRRDTSIDKEPGTLAPGAALGVVWRVEGWEIGPTVRGAYFDEPTLFSSRRTLMMSAGGRARWFAFPTSSLSPFVDVGADLMVFAVDDAGNIGPSAHGGAGVEVFHDDGHHRLRFELGVDVPTFALAYPEVSLACAGCGRSSATERIYLVPATLAATWTF